MKRICPFLPPCVAGGWLLSAKLSSSVTCSELPSYNKRMNQQDVDQHYTLKPYFLCLFLVIWFLAGAILRVEADACQTINSSAVIIMGVSEGGRPQPFPVFWGLCREVLSIRVTCFSSSALQEQLNHPKKYHVWLRSKSTMQKTATQAEYQSLKNRS